MMVSVPPSAQGRAIDVGVAVVRAQRNGPVVQSFRFVELSQVHRGSGQRVECMNVIASQSQRLRTAAISTGMAFTVHMQLGNAQ